MTHTSEKEFIREDGSVDTTKAMEAGHDERTEALRAMGRAVSHWVSSWLPTSTKGKAIKSA
ncbi:MAG: hypothetical protein ACSHXD_15275 [Marinosulfonomonas sp.]